MNFARTIAAVAVAVCISSASSVSACGLLGCGNDCCDAAPVCCEAPAPVCCEPAPVCCPSAPVKVSWCVQNPLTCCPVEVSACVPACCENVIPELVCCKKGFLGRKVMTFSFPCCDTCVDVVFTPLGRVIVRD